MIGIDTNVLLRLGDDDEPDQRDRARALVRSQGANGCFVNAIVLAEFAWTLTRSYKLSRGDAAARIAVILESPEFVVASLDEASRAVQKSATAPPISPITFWRRSTSLPAARRLRPSMLTRSNPASPLLPFRPPPDCTRLRFYKMPSSRNVAPPDLAAPRALRRNVRPDDRRPDAPRRHRARHRGREGFHHLRRGGEVRRRQGDPRRHGAGADDPRARRRRHRHHQRRHPRPLGDRQGRRRPEGRAHRGDRQGRQSRHPAGRHHHRRPGHRGDRGRGQDPHRRRLRHPHPFHLPPADRGGADVGRHLDAGRRHRPGDRHLRHHLHARPLAHPAHDRGRGRLSDEPRLRRQGQRLQARRAGRAGQGRRLRAQTARGLGHDAGRDRLLPFASPTITTCRS